MMWQSCDDCLDNVRKCGAMLETAPWPLLYVRKHAQQTGFLDTSNHRFQLHVPT